MRPEYDFSGGERGKYAKPAGIPNRIFRGGYMRTSKGAYVATAAIAAVGLALSVAALRLINGRWQSLGELGPMIVLYAAMAIFIPYRRARAGGKLRPPR